MCTGVDSLSNQSKESYMEQFHEGGVPQLFALLTSEPDPMKRWVSVPLAVSDHSLRWFHFFPCLFNVVCVFDVCFKARLFDLCAFEYLAMCHSILDRSAYSFDSFGFSETIDEDDNKQNSLAENCTVAYMSQCMPLTKCKSQCESMGSAGFR